MSRSQKFKALRGFRDFPPEDLHLREHLFAAWRGVARRYGFQEYDGPPLESLELYVEKSGEEIVGQLYAFRDRGERDVALRPEMTPSLARILGERSRALPKPVRWFSIPQLFRYERQQRGRLREHFQWNVDLVGEGGVEADAEVLSVALDALRALGLEPEDICARVSDRGLLAALLRGAGVAEDRLTAAYAIVDKVEREPHERLAERLQNEAGLDAGGAARVLGIFETPGIEAVRTAYGDDPEVAERLEAMERYLAVLDDLGQGPYVEFDLTIVRGLAYYTGIVFEIFDRKGEFRAICGGGRYDRLLELVGGEPLPAAGFGMGDVVLGELLRERGRAPEYRRGVDFFIVAIDEELRPLARRIAAALRGTGSSVVLPLRHVAVRKQFHAAAAEGAREVIVLGPDEVVRGVALIRSMASGEERQASLDALTAGDVAGDGLTAVPAAGGRDGPGPDGAPGSGETR